MSNFHRRIYRDLSRGLACLSLLAAPVLAAEPAARDWAATTREDVLAFDGWLQAAYPAVVDDSGADFNRRWAEAKRIALERASKAEAYAGWQYTLYALAATARDAHVTLAELAPPTERRWAGLALERRGDDYIARRPAGVSEGVETRVPDGARVLGCDGEPVAVAARKRLDLFVTNWEDRGLTTMRVSSLFVDRGNPFVPALKTCTFEIDGEPVPLVLNWSLIDVKTMAAAFAPFRRVKLQDQRVDLSYDENGAAWITLGNLTDFAAHTKLQEEVAGQRKKILAARYLVIDLRGNGGGDSSMADRLAQTLWGEDSLVPAPPAPPKRWRASAFVIETIQGMRDATAASSNPNPGLIAAADALLPRLRAALEAGQPMADDPGLTPVVGPAQRARRAPSHARPVFVLTDGGCGSSCVLATYLFKRMGARQVGEPTIMNTMYGEAWVQRPLPSQLAIAILPIASMPYPPGTLGGDLPEIPWTGASEDEAGLKALIAAEAKRH